MFTKIVCAVGLMTAILSIGDAQADKSEGKMSIGQRFHHETSFGDRGYKGDGSYRGRNLPLYKVYDGALTVSLPPPKPGSRSVEEAIAQRRSTRRFADRPISLEELSQLLLAAAGITYDRKGLFLRAAPSGGALYPCEIYVVAQTIDSLKAGLYHYQVSDSTLELVEETDLGRQLHLVSHRQDAVGSSPATLILTARFERSTRKYGDRGFRYTYIEAGAIAENICLQTTSLGLGTVCIGAFNDDALNKLLGIDGDEETALLIMPVGIPR